MSIKVPKNQILWVTQKDKDGKPQYLITSDNQRTKYFLYGVNKDDTITKIKTSKIPIFKETESDYE